MQLITDRAGTLARFEQLPLDCLKALALHCSSDVGGRMLNFGDAVICSYGHEALLKRGFAGDFNAMLAWWRANRQDAISGQSQGFKGESQR